ncbi:MAG: FliH/SctL family protein [Syntrophales bacterium]|nr:FliH/SctL family protein [Syntrophales bacterium]
MSNKIIKAREIELKDAVVENSVKFVRSDFGIKNFEDQARVLRRVEEMGERNPGAGALERAKDEINRERMRLSSALQSAEKMIEGVQLLKEEIVRNSEKWIIDLIFAITEKVIHKEATTNRDVVAAVLRDAVVSVRNQENIKVRMSPLDYRYLREVNPQFLNQLHGAEAMSIEEDDEIMQGGVVIETRCGGVDARLDHQLNKLKEEIV